MTTTAENVRVGTTGEIHVGPTTATLPNDVVDDVNAEFDGLGYLSDAGVTVHIGEERQDIHAWQNGDTVRKVRSSHDVTFQFTMIETSDYTLETYYGNYEDGVVHGNSDEMPRRSWVFDVIDGDALMRYVVADGQVTERGDVVYVNADAVGYPVTVTAYADTAGDKFTLYMVGAGSGGS